MRRYHTAGPGIPEKPFSHVNAELEGEFTVVHWEQRGAGKSYDSRIPPETMNVLNSFARR